AHADLNLPHYSLTGNLHGMPLGLLLDMEHSVSRHIPWLHPLLKPQDIFYLGLRQLDPYEKYIIDEWQIPHLTSEQCKDITPSLASQIINKWLGYHPLHISFDIDSLDPSEAPSTGCTEPNGLSHQWVKDVLKLLPTDIFIPSIDIVEINPLIGNATEVFETFHIAFETIQPLFKGGSDESHHISKNQNYLLSSPPVYPPHWVLF
ncbi:MAG: arginase family protein, partial [Bdellovibrionaceae bacterium]|nr:arginase family protein [Pseudobdellovibrionaceae bacterium]